MCVATLPCERFKNVTYSDVIYNVLLPYCSYQSIITLANRWQKLANYGVYWSVDLFTQWVWVLISASDCDFIQYY